MESYQVNILNPKALKLLKELAELKLISISKQSENAFMDAVASLRSNEENAPDFETITQLVEEARQERYDKKSWPNYSWYQPLD